MKYHLYLVLAGLITCALLFTGCANIEGAIENRIYEKTREKGTRSWDDDSFNVHDLGQDTFRITYSVDEDDFESKDDQNKANEKLIKYASKIAGSHGYTHFTTSGKGQTVRSKIVMLKTLIKCYKKDIDEIPANALEAEVAVKK